MNIYSSISSKVFKNMVFGIGFDEFSNGIFFFGDF